MTIDSRSRAPAKVVLAVLALTLWGVWWGVALVKLGLPFAARTWIILPAFGVDFWTQTDYAARTWAGWVDPYVDHGHLFHYPPIVIRLFLWTPFFRMPTALRIWISLLIGLLVLGTARACTTRRLLGIEPVHLSIALVAVLFSFPVLFQLERSNFDLITLAAVLLAGDIARRYGKSGEFLAGCVLAVGPWVKIYPGLMGVGLLALRRFRILSGFIVGALAIGLAAPAETLRSFEVLHIAMERARFLAHGGDYWPWNHSLSVAWLQLAELAEQKGFGDILTRIPGSVGAAAFIVPMLAWVSIHVWRCRGSEPLTYPLLLWLLALGSFVGEIANDYSLAFLPLATVAVYSRRDPLLVHAGMAALFLWWQPIALPISSMLLLCCKLVGVVAVAAMLIRRAGELGAMTPPREVAPSG